MRGVRVSFRTAGMVCVFLAGLLVAAVVATGGSAQDTTTTETTTAIETTTVEPSTVVQTETVEHTTTRVLTLPTTTSASETSSETPTWAWVVIAALAVGLVAAIIGLLTRRGHGGVPAEQRQRQLHAAMGSWVGQGWAVESEAADSAVLRRGAERMLVSVDAAGQVATRPLA